MLITRRYELDMGHCLPDHQGKCYRPHGHRYRVEASIGAEQLAESGSERGMIQDFGNVKGAMAYVLDAYDHRFVMCKDDPRAVRAAAVFEGVVMLDYPPTAEILAFTWAGELASALDLRALRVYETPNCWADWSCW